MSFINNWLREDIKAINAYHTPSAKNLIKLDAMESPFDFSQELTEQYLKYLANAQINRYPDPEAINLTQDLRELMNIPSEFSILLGNGSDELIQLLALACQPNDNILSVEPSFVMYQMIAKFTHLKYKSINLDKNFNLSLDKTLSAITQHNPKLIFIAYPNNPTGNAFAREDIEKIIQSTDALVVLDEAYYAYADDSFISDIHKYDNLVVLRTVSKIGFAGLRLGLLIGNKNTINELNKLRLPYNINILTQVSGNFLLTQKDTINHNAQIIVKEREFLAMELKKINELIVFPSQANFILFSASKANQLFNFLKDSGILIKNLSSAPKLKNCLRVSVGMPSQNRQFIKIIKKFYG